MQHEPCLRSGFARAIALETPSERESEQTRVLSRKGQPVLSPFRPDQTGGQVSSVMIEDL